jgi:extracellular factor (EF) 3-hydroxypalmitic acid methyl ester biosynthesis protein
MNANTGNWLGRTLPRGGSYVADRLRRIARQVVASASTGARAAWTPGQIEAEIYAFAAYLPRLYEEDPRVFDAQFHDRLCQIDAMSRTCPDQRSRLMALCLEVCGEELDRGTIHSHCRSRPLGYSGDHLLIDWLYTGRTGSTGTGQLWDRFSYRQVMAQVIRNRKVFLGAVLSDLCHKAHGGLSVLALACGGCRDVAHAIARCGTRIEGSYIHCVDPDERAIAYAARSTHKWVANLRVHLETADLFRLRPPRRYDLVWAASLLDTLDERSAILLLQRIWNWISPGGQMILGYSHPRHPDRNYLEWCLDWWLTYRTETEVYRLCKQAGIARDFMDIDEEPLGVSQFCIVTRPKWLPG